MTDISDFFAWATKERRVTLKHLAGEHDQSTHGHGGGGEQGNSDYLQRELDKGKHERQMSNFSPLRDKVNAANVTDFLLDADDGKIQLATRDGKLVKVSNDMKGWNYYIDGALKEQGINFWADHIKIFNKYDIGQIPKG